MIRVRIGDSERKFDEASPQWINEQINRRRADGHPVCVRVLINIGTVNLALATGDCPGGGGGDRPPNDQEKALLETWERLHLHTSDFTGGNLVAFLRQLS